MKEYKHEFKIDRARWACGRNAGRVTPSLLNDRGQMCCLGFLAASCDIKRADRLGVAMPVDLLSAGEYVRGRAKLLRLLDEKESSFQHINDCEFASISKRRRDAHREERLKRMFAAAGIKVDFVGEYLEE